MKRMNFQNVIPSISIDNFKDHSVLVFDIISRQVASEHCHCHELVEEPVRLELWFNSPLVNVTEVFVLGEHKSSVAVDNFGALAMNL